MVCELSLFENLRAVNQGPEFHKANRLGHLTAAVIGMVPFLMSTGRIKCPDRNDFIMTENKKNYIKLRCNNIPRIDEQK